MGWLSHFDHCTVVQAVPFATTICADPIKALLMKHLSPWLLHPLQILCHHSHLLMVGSSPHKSSLGLQGKEALLALLEVCDLYTSILFLTKLQCLTPNDQQVERQDGRNLTIQKSQSPMVFSHQLGSKLTRIWRESSPTLLILAIASPSPQSWSTCRCQCERRLTCSTGSLLVHSGSIKSIFACQQSSCPLRCGGTSSILLMLTIWP